ncbi:MAG TPA: thioesterase [Tenuifilaceae bacterium]|nr:thioesterase [Tenuifilaceae bacterium]
MTNQKQHGHTPTDGIRALTREFAVSSFHSDFTGHLSLNSLFHLFQEIAWEHAKLNQFGYENLQEHGFFWVLSRVKVEIDQLPRWTEAFSLKTWPSGIEGPFALRDFVVSDEWGKRLVNATSSWLIVDVKSRRPQRPDVLFSRFPLEDVERATSVNAPRLPIPQEAVMRSYDLVTRISDIDVNMHVNNTRYIEWAFNAFSQEEFKDFTVKKIDINYLSECFFGDNVTIQLIDLHNHEFGVLITRKSDRKHLAVVRFLTEQNVK